MSNKGNLRFTVDLPGLREALDEVEDEIDNAVDDALSEAVSAGRTAANRHIKSHDKVWTEELISSWVPYNRKIAGEQRMVGWTNYAGHASAIDEGATYGLKKPHFGNLKAYVMSEYGVSDEQEANLIANSLMNTIYKNGIEGIYYSDVAAQAMAETFEKEMETNE